jgi:phage terminase small subunit
MAKKGKVGRKARATAAKATNGSSARIPLKRICSDLGIEPKRARVKLRRVWRKDEEEGAVAFHSRGSRWDLTAKEAKEVTAILAG